MKDEEPFLVTFSDFKHVCKKAKRKIKWGALVGVLFFTLFTLLRDPTYLVEATFREKGLANNKASNLGALLSGKSEEQGKGLSMLTSNRLMGDVIKKLGLQANFVPLHAPNRRIKNIFQNLRVDYALFKSLPRPGIPDLFKPLIARDIEFDGEVSETFYFIPASNETYEIADKFKEVIGEGRYGVPFKGKGFALTIDKAFPEAKPRKMLFSLSPLEPLAKGLGAKVKVGIDPKDKSLIKIKYDNPDRFLAAGFVNTLMSAYQQFLKKEQERVVEEQLVYLRRRQNEQEGVLRKMMEEYADEQVSDVSRSGFVNSETALRFLGASQQQIKQRMFDLDLAIKRLEKGREENSVLIDFYRPDGDAAVLNKLLTEIRVLNEKADSIDLSLKSDPSPEPRNNEEEFSRQFEEYSEVQEAVDELQQLLAALEGDTLIEPSAKLLGNPYFTIKNWHERLVVVREALKGMESKGWYEKEKEWANLKGQYITYLRNLLHFYHVREKTIKERLAHQTSPQEDFQGITLSLAEEIFVAYSKELSEAEAKMVQLQFIVEHLGDEDFELSPLNAFLTDPVSQKIVEKYSELLLALQDRDNRSDREQARIKNELLLQRGFLEMHLTQTGQLLSLRAELLRDKIRALQHVSLVLVQQRISILEKQIDDYIAARLLDLQQEKEVLALQLKDVSRELAKVPHKLITEKFIERQVEMNQRIDQEIAHLVESKNIANNMEVVESAPVDIAVPPVYPKAPRILLFAMAGAFAGGFLTLCATLVREAAKGIVATKENLTEYNQHVAGSLSRALTSPLRDRDLETLRRVMTHFSPNKEFSLSTLLLIGDGPDYSLELANLAKLKGLKTLIVSTLFDEGEPLSEKGLLQYLEGKLEEPEVLQRVGVDYISSGGYSRFSKELLASERFERLIQNAASQYDWVIQISRKAPAGAEAEGLLRNASSTAVSLQGEKLEELVCYFNKAKEFGSNRVTFILLDE